MHTVAEARTIFKLRKALYVAFKLNKINKLNDMDPLGRIAQRPPIFHALE
jgi:hypothetical protein